MLCRVPETYREGLASAAHSSCCCSWLSWRRPLRTARRRSSMYLRSTTPIQRSQCGGYVSRWRQSQEQEGKAPTRSSKIRSNKNALMYATPCAATRLPFAAPWQNGCMPCHLPRMHQHCAADLRTVTCACTAHHRCQSSNLTHWAFLACSMLHTHFISVL